MVVNISNHPKIGNVKRKINIGNFIIDYDAKVAVIVFAIQHYDEDDIPMPEIASVPGQFIVGAGKKVDPDTGIKSNEPTAVDEFDFLDNILKMANVTPKTLCVQRVQISDSRGNFNDYNKLMLL